MKFKTEYFRVKCSCRSVGECEHNDFAWMKALNTCVDAFALEMKKKLRQKFLEGRHGWDSPDWPKDDIRRRMYEHIDKGDPVDVANFAMFLWNRD